MSRESKRQIKAQRREARKRAEKTRQQLADHCALWMYDAEDAWFAKDFPRARRCFQRILHVRPTHQAANERMAELFFIDGLQAEGLRHFERLVAAPEFPIIDSRVVTTPPQPVSRIVITPLSPGGRVTPLGTFTFTRLQS